MNILIDADACPSVNLITDIAKKHHIDLLIYTDINHNIINDYAKITVLSKGYQSVDMCIANEIKKGDILITQDFGLATIALAKKAYAVHPKGMVYDDDNIEHLLYERHVSAKLRKNSKHIKGPKKRTLDDDNHLVESLETLIKKGDINE